MDTAAPEHTAPSLAEILGQASSNSHHYKDSRLSPNVLNVLAQWRKEFFQRSIESLARDIAHKGLLNPLTVARFTPAQAEAYVVIVNALWNERFDAAHLKRIREGDEEVVYVLLAGERRFRACTLLYTHGCEDCRKKFGSGAPGKCFRRHLKGGKIHVRVVRDVSPRAAIDIQFSENTYEPPQADDQASGYLRYFNFLKAQDLKLTLTAFAKEVGRNESTIRKAFDYCSLPEDIHLAVRKRELSYGLAIELVRAHRHPKIDAHEFGYWFTKAKLDGLTVTKFRELLLARINELESGQVSFFTMMNAGGLDAMLRKKRRATVDARINETLEEALGFMDRLKRLIDRGEIAREDSPFASGGAISALIRIAELLRVLTAALHHEMTRKQREHIEHSLNEAEPLLIALRQHFNE